MLNQELIVLGVEPGSIPPAIWEQLVHDSAGKSVKDVYTDIGLGRRLAAVVARRLLPRDDSLHPEGSKPAALVIRGTEGMAIQLAPCCHPIPGDAIIGSIRKGQGLVIHTHDCPAIRKSRSIEPQKWIDVEWEPEPGKLFNVSLRITAKNARGVLGRIATSISEIGSNIENVSMEEQSPGLYTVLHFIVQVSGRAHLAQLLRGLRRIPEVVRIARERE